MKNQVNENGTAQEEQFSSASQPFPSGQQTATLWKDPYWISSLASLPYSDVFASGSCNGTIKLWKLEQNNKAFSLLKEVPMLGWVNSMCFTGEGKKLIVGVGQEHKLGRWTKVKAAKNGVVTITLRKTN